MLCVEWLCTHERMSPEVAYIFSAAARYRRATVGSSHDGAHPDNTALHAGKVYFVPLNIYRVVLHLLWQRHGAAGSDSGLGTILNYLRGAASNSRAQRSRTWDAQRAPPRATAWAPR